MGAFALPSGRANPWVAAAEHHASTAGDVPVAGVIHHGVAESQYPVGDGSGGYLLFLGRMSPTKGVREAIDVARRTCVRLVIAAKMREPSERQDFESDIGPLLGAGVTYAGEVGGAAKLERRCTESVRSTAVLVAPPSKHGSRLGAWRPTTSTCTETSWPRAISTSRRPSAA